MRKIKGHNTVIHPRHNAIYMQ